MAQTDGLVIVPAGAGAGKTHKIKETLKDWVIDKTVSPERILAVTFTEAAASELRERIRSTLLGENMIDAALAVEQAYVSTIHGLGLRILTEHAFAAGSSPKPRHLADAERDLLIRQALAHAKSLDPVKDDPERFGYQPNYHSGTSIEDNLRKRVLATIDLLRGLGEAGQAPDLIDTGVTRLDQLYGEPMEVNAAKQNLISAITEMLEEFPEGGMANISAKTNINKLGDDLQLFQKVVKNHAVLDKDWGIWQKLRNLFTSNNSSKTPEGYDEHAIAIMAAADALQNHPGPLEDAKTHFRCLVSCAQEVMALYEARKKALGLIDYGDMISAAEQLLRQNPEVRQAVLNEVDCVIIDEFQDTSPVQFALLWQLGKHAPRSLLVGDVKQSIMSFQGADPRLSSALANANPDSIDPLPKNWRSTPEVMEFVNAMGKGLFRENYRRLEPTRPSFGAHAIEVLKIQNGRKVRKHSKPHEHVAERVAQILTANELVTDRQTKEVRPARPSDVAILVYQHKTAEAYADELRARGVPVRISEKGWMDSSVIQVALAALSYAANPEDIHSALMVRTLGPNPISLQDALSQQISGQLFNDPHLKRLQELSGTLACAPVPDSLSLVLEAANLIPWIAGQEDARQARADVLKLESEAQEFELAHRDLKAASGFHGETIKVFLGWLKTKIEEVENDQRPDPSANATQAVEITTWHASKGREWPISVVAQMDYNILERAGTTSVRFNALDQIEDLDAVFSSATLVHTPFFVAKEVTRKFVESRRDDFETNAAHLLYVAMTRARDRLILEWPEFLKERSDDERGATCLFHVFEDRCRPMVHDGSMIVADTECPAKVITVPAVASYTEYSSDELASVPLFGAKAPLEAEPQTPWLVNPSMLPKSEPAPNTQMVSLGDPWPQQENNAHRGTALHIAIHALLKRPDLKLQVSGATGLDPDTVELVAERAEALKTWLSDQGYPELHCEIQISETTPEGAEISGTIDLLAVGPNGCMLVDHKSGGLGEGMGDYWPQLSTYSKLVKQKFPSLKLRGAAIHWIDHGRLDLVRTKSNE